MAARNVFFRLATVALLLALSGPGATAQTAATNRVMREKLMHSQKILEAIMTSDFKGLEEHGAAIVNLTKTEGWSVLKSAEYARRSEAFVHALDDLITSAKAKDLDSAAVRYMSLTLACFECHRQIKNMRLASR